MPPDRRRGLIALLGAILVALVAATASTSYTRDVLQHAVRRWQWPVYASERRSLAPPSWVSDGAASYAVCSHASTAVVFTGEMGEAGEAIAYECVAIANKRVALLGTRQDMASWSANGEDPIYTLERGQTVVPGLHDAHGHVLDLGWSRAAVDLVGAASRAEVVKRIEAHVRAHPELQNDPSRWIEGIGWDQTRWSPATFPIAEELTASSALLAGRRIYLRRVDVHALWLSRAALDAMEEAGVMPAASEEIEGGVVMRDEHGRPNGCLLDKAMDLAYKVIPPWTDVERDRFLDVAADELLSVGITSVGDAAVDLDSIAFYQERQAKRGLPIRIYAMLACPPDTRRCAAMAQERAGLPIVARPLSDERLTVRTVKLFADGALGSWGSAMWEPYADRDDWTGLLLIPADDVEPLIRYWVEEGWNVATHCIGDRAQTIALDAYEAVQKNSSSAVVDPRFRIEHAQIVRTDDIIRFGALGVIASMQPTHCTSDMAYVERRIGAQRARDGAYAWQAMLQANASLAFGSDFPVELPNPVHGFYSAVTRLDANQRAPPTSFAVTAGESGQGWYAEQTVSRAQALHAFTVAPAFAQFEEHVGGSLTQGKRADFAILNDDLIRQTDLRALRSTSVLATFLDGKLAWRRAR